MEKVRHTLFSISQAFGLILCVVFGLGVVGYYLAPDVRLFQHLRDSLQLSLLGSLLYMNGSLAKENMRLKGKV